MKRRLAELERSTTVSFSIGDSLVARCWLVTSRQVDWWLTTGSARVVGERGEERTTYVHNLRKLVQLLKAAAP